MNVLAAMEDTMALAEASWGAIQETTVMPDELRLSHLRHMRTRMRLDKKMSPMKQNRWLGWMQAAIVSWGVASLADFIEINKKHRDNVVPSYRDGFLYRYDATTQTFDRKGDKK